MTLPKNRTDCTPQALLKEMFSFIYDEQEAGNQRLLDIWARPLAEKLTSGWSQGFRRLQKCEDPKTLWAYPDDSESRFREGDLLHLHGGDALEQPLCGQVSLEREEDERWLLRGNRVPAVWDQHPGGPCYADPDGMDLTSYYEDSLRDIATSQIGREILLPLLSGDLDICFDERDVSEGERIALAEGLNAKQAQALGLAYGAEQIACIQGPPGTGKTLVLALLARLMAARGERILMTSHTHMAINNALNKIHARGVPTVKIGRDTQRKGLADAIRCAPGLDAWTDRPADGGYVVGATPFATCNASLKNYEFDAVLFDEASQITTPLALMAMRKGRRFILIGDQKQLPPVLLSRSVLAKDASSIFVRLTSKEADHSIMLDETYRMNKWLSGWPSRTYYDGKLRSAGPNRERRFELARVEPRLAAVFDPAASAVFIPTLDRSAGARNDRDAKLVVDLCQAAAEAGLPLSEIGVVSPYRAHGRAVRTFLIERFGRTAARQVVADTVERMQGQERELIILSLATGDKVFLGGVAEFFFQPERLNVSITRAKTKLIVIGPDISHIPKIPDRRVQHWAEQYLDMIGQCRRVTL